MNNPAIKWAAVIVAIALIIVIGLIVMTGDKDEAQSSAGEPAAAAATAEPEATAAPQEPAVPEATQQPQSEGQQAHSDEDAQGTTLYEGALAGLTEEEIGKMAMEEENSPLRTDDSGAESAMD